jgi:hypothetical protein
VARLLRPKVLVVVAAVVVVAALAAAVAGGLFLRDTARPASVTAALRLFREENPNPTGDEGVYLYDTTGGESLDVLGGVTHRYPATTTIALTRAGCGAAAVAGAHGAVDDLGALPELARTRRAELRRGAQLLRQGRPHELPLRQRAQHVHLRLAARA